MAGMTCARAQQQNFMFAPSPRYLRGACSRTQRNRALSHQNRSTPWPTSQPFVRTPPADFAPSAWQLPRCSRWSAAALSPEAPTPAAPPSARYEALDDDHLQHLVHYVMSRIDAPQQQQVKQVAHAAHEDLQALARRAQEARAPRARTLLADVIDQGGLERIRTAEMRIADERSRRVDRLLMDIAAVLTPQQRSQLRAEMTN